MLELVDEEGFGAVGVDLILSEKVVDGDSYFEQTMVNEYDENVSSLAVLGLFLR